MTANTNLTQGSLRGYRVLAVDYDGTLARNGSVLPETLQALARFRTGGRRLILVTGRRLRYLPVSFDSRELFDVIVAENGGVLFTPGSGQRWLLANGPPRILISKLREQSVRPLGLGQVLLTTSGKHEEMVSNTLAQLALDSQFHVSRNRSFIMVLPREVDKGRGLVAAVGTLGLRLDDVVGVGDAENDIEFLKLCGVSIAVANALPSVRERVHYVTKGSYGEGIIQIVREMLNV